VFKRAAARVEAALQAAGYTVIINGKRPRKGSFVVRLHDEDTGDDDQQYADTASIAEPVIQLLDMPRPFKLLREMDIDSVIAAIIEEHS